MPATYYIKLTNAGLAALATAQATGTPVSISHFAVGDSNGAYYEPSESQTALVNEVWRDNVNRVYIHLNNPNWAVVEALIPYSDGGFDIREAGAFSSNGTLLAVGKYPLTNKPSPDSGSAKDLYVRMIMQISNAETVEQTIDQSLVMATREYVDSKDFKESVIAATTGSITLSGLQTVDGVVLSVNDRVLVKNQATASQNGIYLVKSAAWVRDYAADNSLELTPNLFVIVEKGTANADTGWMLTTDGPITIGTTALTFKQMLGDWQPLDGTLTALSGITTSADKLIYATGSDQFATTDLSAFGRTLIDDADAAAARSTLGAAPLDSPSLTGNPTGPTPEQFDNDTSLATSQFVQRALGNMRAATGFSANATLTSDHIGQMVQCASAGPYTITLPSVSGVPDGALIEIVSSATGTITIARQGSDVIYPNLGSGVASIGLGNGDTAKLVKITGGWALIAGSASLRYSNSDFGKSLSANGYQKLPSGLIIQWGTTGSSSNTGYVNVTFPLTFPTACKSLTMAPHSDGSTLGCAQMQYPPSQTGFNFEVRNTSGARALWWNAFYIAIGY